VKIREKSVTMLHSHLNSVHGNMSTWPV